MNQTHICNLELQELRARFQIKLVEAPPHTSPQVSVSAGSSKVVTLLQLFFICMAVIAFDSGHCSSALLYLVPQEACAS